MTETQAPRTISRRQSYRGQHVNVRFRDGITANGALIAWGPQVIRVMDTSDGTSAWIERPAVLIDSVTEGTLGRA